ncbi:LysM peptidoglycan-binding domain-containing protein [Rhodobacterales bacterium]|nr:LysM peptidoglycan-binding domain-containing protein [Rhodobacterales bacterium]
MNKQTLIWALIVAVPVGLAALATGIVYRDTGKLPFQEEAGTSQTSGADGQTASSQNAPEPDETGEPETAGAVQIDETASEGAEPAAPLHGPSFDVVGVEPTGETVVAGRSEAGAIVALTANGKVVGKSIANEAGEWTIILDEPFKPGDYDVGLEVHDETGKSVEKSEQRLAVSVPPGSKQKPLVVLNTPDGPSAILQKPEDEVEVAAATAPASGSQDQQSAGDPTEAQPQGTASAEEPSEASIADAGDQGSAGQEGGSSTAGVTVTARQDDQSASQTSEAGSASTASADAPTSQKGDAKVSASASAETGDEAAGNAPAATAQAGGTADDAADVAGDGVSVTVEAVESEQDKVYVAGTGEPGTSVRVYVGDEFQGEAEVNSTGKWLVQGTKNVAEGNVEVRADQIAQDGNSVEARAAVTFEKSEDRQIVLTKVVASGAGSGKSGQGADVRKSLPVVIIRKGDNLWRISRRLYGDGVRYTTIYQANQDQIRNPDLIYPGQVFLTPEGDLSWQPAENEPG